VPYALTDHKGESYIPLALITLIGSFIVGLRIAGVVIFLDFYGFIPKSQEVYGVGVGVKSYGGLAKNITLILPAVICDRKVLQISNAKTIKIDGKFYYKVWIEKPNHRNDYFYFECLNKRRSKDVRVSDDKVCVYFENAEKLKVTYSVYIAEIGRESSLVHLLSFIANKNDCGKWRNVR